MVSVATIHVEPMGLYGGKQTSLDALTVKIKTPAFIARRMCEGGKT